MTTQEYHQLQLQHTEYVSRLMLFLLLKVGEDYEHARQHAEEAWEKEEGG